jgi:hypothetical protein
MKSIGFGYPGGPDRAANLELPVTSYSGGWKMKMQLCAWDVGGYHHGQKHLWCGIVMGKHM